MESIVTLLQLLQNRGIIFGYLSLFDYLCTSKIQKTPLTMSQKEQKKWEEMICLTTDHEVEEMLRTCSRLVVMRDRHIVGELKGKDLNQAQVMKTIAGGETKDEK